MYVMMLGFDSNMQVLGESSFMIVHIDGICVWDTTLNLFPFQC